MILTDKTRILIVSVLVVLGFITGILWGRFVRWTPSDVQPIVSERIKDAGENGHFGEPADTIPMPDDVLQRIP